MNIIIIIVFLIIACTVNAKVSVVSVSMKSLFASVHAKELTKVINAAEDEGCLLFNTITYADATYLYFRCP
jgi:hypothetical protein